MRPCLFQNSKNNEQQKATRSIPGHRICFPRRALNCPINLPESPSYLGERQHARGIPAVLGEDFEHRITQPAFMPSISSAHASVLGATLTCLLSTKNLTFQHEVTENIRAETASREKKAVHRYTTPNIQRSPFRLCAFGAAV